jgi:hypothetical protein
MAKFLTNAAGVLQEVAAATDGGAGNANKIPQLDGVGRLTSAMMPAGLGADVGIILASETLVAGDFVNIWDNVGVANVRKADASTAGKEAHGFVLAGFAGAANATVYFEGVNDQLTAMTPGRAYLSAAQAGKAVAAAPSATGNAVQYLGVAISATEINFEAAQPIILA